MPWSLHVFCMYSCEPGNSSIILSSLIHCSIFSKQGMRMQSWSFHYAVTNNNRIWILWLSLHGLSWKGARHSYSLFLCRRRSMSIIPEDRKSSNRWWVRKGSRLEIVKWSGYAEVRIKPQKGWELKRSLHVVLPPDLHTLHLTYACTQA